MCAVVLLLAEACLHCVAAQTSAHYPLLRGLSYAGLPSTCMQTCAFDADIGQDSDLPRLRKGLDRWSAQVCARKRCCRVGATCYACIVTDRSFIHEPTSCVLRVYVFGKSRSSYMHAKVGPASLAIARACCLSTAVTQVLECACLESFSLSADFGRCSLCRKLSASSCLASYHQTAMLYGHLHRGRCQHPESYDGPKHCVKVVTVHAECVRVPLGSVCLSGGACRLWKGLVPLWGRQIPYTMMKFGKPLQSMHTSDMLQHSQCDIRQADRQTGRV